MGGTGTTIDNGGIIGIPTQNPLAQKYQNAKDSADLCERILGKPITLRRARIIQLNLQYAVQTIQNQQIKEYNSIAAAEEQLFINRCTAIQTQIQQYTFHQPPDRIPTGPVNPGTKTL